MDWSFSFGILLVGIAFGAALVARAATGKINEAETYAAVMYTTISVAHRRLSEELVKGDAALREEVKKFLPIFEQLL